MTEVLSATESLDIRPRYDPPRYPAASWHDIEEFFCWLSDTLDQRPMIDLIRHIRSTYAPGRLFGLKSMHTLIVSQHNPVLWSHEVLRIDLDRNTQEFEFVYIARWFRPVVRRRYKQEDAIAKFDRFVQMIRW